MHDLYRTLHSHYREVVHGCTVYEPKDGIQ
jgi:hypothetical protein